MYQDSQFIGLLQHTHEKNVYTTAGEKPQFDVHCGWKAWFMSFMLTDVTIVLCWQWNMLQHKVPLSKPSHKVFFYHYNQNIAHLKLPRHM